MGFSVIFNYGTKSPLKTIINSELIKMISKR